MNHVNMNEQHENRLSDSQLCLKLLNIRLVFSGSMSNSNNTDTHSAQCLCASKISRISDRVCQRFSLIKEAVCLARIIQTKTLKPRDIRVTYFPGICDSLSSVLQWLPIASLHNHNFDFVLLTLQCRDLLGMIGDVTSNIHASWIMTMEGAWHSQNQH